MGRIVTTWEENGMLHTITATPIVSNTNTNNDTGKDMLTVFEWYGGTPPLKTGENVYKAAVAAKAVISSKEVNTAKYTGKVMLYERSFLDSYFGKPSTPNVSYVAKPAVISKTYNESNEDELDLPF